MGPSQIHLLSARPRGVHREPARTGGFRQIYPGQDGGKVFYGGEECYPRDPSDGAGDVHAGGVGVVPATAGTLEIGPDSGLCGVLRQVEPGDEIVLQPGDYEGGCVVRRGGLPGAPIVIRAADPEAPPRLMRPGGEVNILEIRASDIVVRGLSFGPTAPDADGIRIITGNRITIEECRFFQMGGSRWSPITPACGASPSDAT